MKESRPSIEQVLGVIHRAEVTRRGFMMTTLAVGFALAVRRCPPRRSSRTQKA